MRFKSFSIAAISLTAGAALTALPAQALSIAPGSTLGIGGGNNGGVIISGSPSNYQFDFLFDGSVAADPGTAGELEIQSKTGSFFSSGITEGSGGARIKDIATVTAGGGYVIPPTSDFISNLVYGGESLSFDLTSLTGFTFNPPGLGALNGFSFSGKFRTASGAILGNGSLNAIFSIDTLTGNTSWAASLTATPIPTPALLPGLLGLGLGVLRKRKAEAEETVEVDA